MHHVANHGIHMARLLPPSTESSRDRKLVGAGVTLLHSLLILSLLHGSTKGDSSADDAAQGGEEGLLVEFIVIPHVSSQLQAHPISASVSSTSLATDSAQGRATIEIVEAAERAEVLSELDDYASLAPTPQSPPNELTASVASGTSASSSLKGGHPSDDLQGGYRAALRAAIQRQWIEQTGRIFPSGCAIRLVQSVGGVLNASSAANCDLSREDRLQLEAAALMAQPLPYAGYEAVFSDDMLLQL